MTLKCSIPEISHVILFVVKNKSKLDVFSLKLPFLQNLITVMASPTFKFLTIIILIMSTKYLTSKFLFGLDCD